MTTARSSCPHVILARGTSPDDISRIKHRHNLGCDSCGLGGPNLWLCLGSGCLYVGCGESASDHSSIHSQEATHRLTLNLTTDRIWCYDCESEVFLGDGNSPPFLLRGTGGSAAAVLSTAVDAERVRERERFAKLLAPGGGLAHDDSDSDLEERGERPRGLTGLYNIGNTCYMNGAIQALSNCPPLTRFFIDCPGYVAGDRKLAKSYTKLMLEMWHKKRPNYVVPSGVANAIRQLHPMFRGYLQHDSQEFLRCLMDYLHEELKQPYPLSSDSAEYPTAVARESDTSDEDVGSFASLPALASDPNLLTDTDYETCDSGLSSEHSSVELGANGFTHQQLVGDAEILDAVSVACEPSLPDEFPNTAADDTLTGVASDDDRASVIKPISDGESFSERHTQHSDVSLSEVRSVDDVESTTGIAATSIETGETEAVKSRGSSSTVTSSSKRTTSSGLGKDLTEGSERSARTRSSPSGVGGAAARTSESRRLQQVRYGSIISDIFDGKILSSVQCMTCHRVSCTNETFQDLSLPIPNKDHLALIRSSQQLVAGGSSAGVTPISLQKSAAEHQAKQGWISYLYGWLKQVPGWFWGPVIRLQDCLAAFFSADDLKGENMYSCERCKKLRNGVKFSKVLALPEVLCVHLKRFRHEYMYSSKISSFVSFPLEGLDMRPYLHKDCKDQVTSYNLVAVICHHGTAGGGHYTSYALNYRNETWYEFDDQIVTEVDLQQVENCEAYVLFYRKANDEMIPLRQRASQIAESGNGSFMRFYVSRQWLNRFNTFAEPGPVNNYDFLCRHGDVQPKKWPSVADLAMEVPPALWEFLHARFGGGPTVNHLSQCQPCLQDLERLKRRQQYEMEKFLELHDEFQRNGTNMTVYAISMPWFREWENFVRARTDDPPGPVDNSKMSVTKNGVAVVAMNSDHGQMSDDIWHFFRGIYGGGPELLVRQGGPHKVDEGGDMTKLGDGAMRQNSAT